MDCAVFAVDRSRDLSLLVPLLFPSFAAYVFAPGVYDEVGGFDAAVDPFL